MEPNSELYGLRAWDAFDRCAKASSARPRRITQFAGHTQAGQLLRLPALSIWRRTWRSPGVHFWLWTKDRNPHASSVQIIFCRRSGPCGPRILPSFAQALDFLERRYRGYFLPAHRRESAEAAAHLAVFRRVHIQAASPSVRGNAPGIFRVVRRPSRVAALLFSFRDRRTRRYRNRCGTGGLSCRCAVSRSMG